MFRPPPSSTLFPYTTLFRSLTGAIRLLLGLGWPMIYFVFAVAGRRRATGGAPQAAPRLPAIRLEREHAVEIVGLVPPLLDRKSTRLNSSHRCISYAVFCLKK